MKILFTLLIFFSIISCQKEDTYCAECFDSLRSGKTNSFCGTEQQCKDFAFDINQGSAINWICQIKKN